MTREMKKAAREWKRAAHERKSIKQEDAEDEAEQGELMLRVRNFVKLLTQRRRARPGAAGDAYLPLLVDGNNTTIKPVKVLGTIRSALSRMNNIIMFG